MTKQWWKYAGIRAIKTVCQTAVATIGTSAVLSEVYWLSVASASVLAGILSLLTSLAGIPEVDNFESHVVELQTRVNHDGLTDLVERGEVENVYDSDIKAE